MGPIARTIAEHAEHIGCDAIVMGRHGKSTLSDILVGSVAIRVCTRPAARDAGAVISSGRFSALKSRAACTAIYPYFLVTPNV